MWKCARAGLIALIFIGLTGCGGCDDEPGSDSDQTGDAATADGYGADGAGGGSGGGTVHTDDCSGARQLCGGECVETRLNPDHCGSCGNSCADGEVCNSGQCVADGDGEGEGCPYGTEACDGACVDLDTNDNHCGECGNSCGDGEGCGYGRCVNAVDLGDAPDQCGDGGPAVDIDFEEEATKEVCSGTVAKTTFKWAVCSCDTISLMNNIETDGFDSQKGPYQPGGFGGGLGSNGLISFGKGTIFGAMWTSSEEGIASAVEMQVKQQVHSQGEVQFGSTGSVDGNAWIGGDVATERPGGGGGGGEPIPFGENLYAPSDVTIGDRVDVAGDIVRQDVDVSTVCNRCEEDEQIPIEQIVKNYQNNNDNDAIGLDEDVLVNPGEELVLKLPCGRYYLSEIDISSKVTIIATGNTALFVDGDINSETSFTIKPSTSGEFDVFVNGDVTLNNDITVGSTAFPAFMRFYANGLWNFKNNGDIGAFIYTIPGGLQTMNNLEVFGGIYTQNLGTMNNVNVHYDREILEVDGDCPDPDDGDGGDDGDAGTGGGDDTGTPSCVQKGDSCSTDGECCSDYLCSDGTCGSSCAESGENCSGDGDCCSPLVCQDGVCQTTSCSNLYETCSQDGDCCSGICSCSGDTCQCTSG